MTVCGVAHALRPWLFVAASASPLSDAGALHLRMRRTGGENAASAVNASDANASSVDGVGATNISSVEELCRGISRGRMRIGASREAGAVSQPEW